MAKCTSNGIPSWFSFGFGIPYVRFHAYPTRCLEESVSIWTTKE